MRIYHPRATLVAALLIVGACSKKEGPDSFMRAVIEGAGGKPQAVWEALPKSYQTDVQQVLEAFAGNMNEQVWNDGFALGQKAVKVLETKKDFVLAVPQVKQMVKPDDVAKGWDPAVRVLSTIVNSDIKTLEGLKKLDVGAFLGGPMAAVVNDLVAIGQLAAASMPMAKDDMKDLGTMRERLKAAKITVEKEDGNTAVVKIEVEGEETETEEMVKVEDKWIPKKLADEWPAAIAKLKASAAMAKLDPSMVAQFNAMKGMFEPMLDGLLAAKTQDEFNAQLDAVMKATMGSNRMARAEPEMDAPPPPAEEVAAPVAKKKSKASKKKAKRER